jgi:hypothetical protein
MKRLEFICALGGIVTVFWPRRHTIIAAMAAMALLPTRTVSTTRHLRQVAFYFFLITDGKTT